MKTLEQRSTRKQLREDLDNSGLSFKSINKGDIKDYQKIQEWANKSMNYIAKILKLGKKDNKFYQALKCLAKTVEVKQTLLNDEREMFETSFNFY